MPQGLEIYNDYGFLQIGGNMANYYQIASGTVSLPYSYGVGTYVTVSPGVSYDILVVSTSSTDTWVVPHAIYSSTQTSSRVFYVNVNPGSPSAGTLNYWCYRSYRALTPATTETGFEIYNSDGTVAFSSKQPKILRCFPKIPVANFAITGGPFPTGSTPTGKTVGWMQYGVNKQTVGGGGGKAFFLGLSVRNTSSTSYEYRWGPRVGFSTGGDINTGGLIPIDVTGY